MRFLQFSKNRMILSGLYSIYVCFIKWLYYYSNNDDIPLNIQPYEDFVYYYEKYPKSMNLCAKIYHAKCMRTSRARKKVVHIVNNYDNVLFLTFTFKNDVLVSTNQKTRRTYVSRFLKKYGLEYIANIDFGEKFGREHYHSVYAGDDVCYKNWPYGNLDFERVIKTPEKIGSYITKLTFHSTKDTTGFLIYSRNIKKYNSPLIQSNFLNKKG